MKQILYIFIFMLPAFSCFAQDNEFDNAVRKSVEHHMKEYPQSTLKDLYKNFFQDVYGPGHLVNDTAAAKNYLLKELDSYTETTGKMAEPTGFRHNYQRINLSVIKNNIIDVDLFFDAFLQSAKEINPIDIEDWKMEWQRIETVIRSMQLTLPDYEKDSNEIKERINEGKYVGHHSKLFNEAYKPHYRIISTKIYNEVIAPILNSNTQN